MDTTTLTHVAAIVIGVVVTLAIVVGGGLSSSKNNDNGKDASSAPGGSGSNSNKNQKKKKKKKGGATGDGAAVEGAASDPVTTKTKPKAVDNGVKKTTKATTTTTNTASGNNGKANKGKDGTNPAVTGASANGDATKNGGGKKKKKKEPAAKSNGKHENGGSKENDSQKANNASAPTTTAASSAAAAAAAEDDSQWQTAPVEEEWNDVSVSKKKKKVVRPKKPEAAAAPAAAAAPTATSTAVTETLTVDAKKVGIIIGPKGATMQAIQEATGCALEINAPSKDEDGGAAAANAKATVVINGSDKDAIAKARKAVRELATKGYATLLQSEDFGEASISVHPRYLSEIVGPSGKTIQALQKTLDVKIVIPPTDWKPNQQLPAGQQVPNCKVGIAGSKENTKLAKAAIQSLMKYHHHEISHPGVIHQEVFVPQEFFHCVIGPRGSEIRHIRGNFKVDIYMPNAESDTENVIVVGRQANVDKAIAYIHVLMERDTEQRQKKYSDEYYG